MHQKITQSWDFNREQQKLKKKVNIFILILSALSVFLFISDMITALKMLSNTKSIKDYYSIT